jgi:hypothetical protein
MEIGEFSKVQDGDPYEKRIAVLELLFEWFENRRNAVAKLKKEEFKLKFKLGKLHVDIMSKPSMYGIDTSKSKRVTVKDVEAAIDRNMQVAQMREKIIELETEVSHCEDMIKVVYDGRMLYDKIIDDGGKGFNVSKGTSVSELSMQERRKKREQNKNK